MKKTSKHEEIFKTALELIAERGFHGVSMSLIAEKADVGTGTIYRYFKSKDDLITALHRNLEEKISAYISDGYAEDQPLKERYVHLVKKIMMYFITYPLHYRYMEQFFNSPYGVSLHRERLLQKSGNHDILTNVFVHGIQQHIVKDLPKAVLFSLTIGPIISLTRYHALGLAEIDDTLVGKITEACWDGVKR